MSNTKVLSSSSDDHPGYGAGSGDVERITYECPCGKGTVVEEHDNIPGFREHTVGMRCDECSEKWQFVAGRTVRGWELEPKTLTP